MKVPKVIIHQQPAKIGLNIMKHQVQQQNPEASIEVEDGPGELSIQSDNIEIDINNYPAEYDLNFKKVMDAGKDYAQAGKQAVLEYIGRKARNGDKLMRIEEGTTVADIAKEISSSKKKELSLKWKRGPKFDVKSNKLEIEYTPKEVITNSESIPFNLELKWGKVDVFMEEYNHIDFEVRGTTLNRQA